MCCIQGTLTLTDIFKVIQAWVCNKTAKIWYILPCPILIMYSSGLILSIFGTNHYQRERVCHVWRPLTLTYIFKVIQPWLCNKTAKIRHILSCPQGPLTLTYIFKIISCDIAYFMDYIHMWHKYNPWGDNVSSVAYRYRKSISIIKLVVSIYIYRVLSIYFLAIFLAVYRVSDNRSTVNTSTSP